MCCGETWVLCSSEAAERPDLQQVRRAQSARFQAECASEHDQARRDGKSSHDHFGPFDQKRLRSLQYRGRDRPGGGNPEDRGAQSALDFGGRKSYKTHTCLPEGLLSFLLSRLFLTAGT